jgi:predicted MFS family arabinose efflux permease
MSIHTRRAPGEISFARLMSLSMAARLLVDTGIQTFSPFLGIIGQGLGVDLVTMGRLLAVQNGAGLLSPALGELAERIGYRRVMQGALLAGALGFGLVGTSQHLTTALLGMVGIGLCLAGFIPTLVAYISARLPYATRARGLGIIEYSWALSGIVGLYVVGQLIAATSWRTPFYGLAVGLGVMAALFGLLPPARGADQPALPHRHAGHPRTASQRITSFFALGPGAASAYSAIAAGALNFFAIMQLNLTYGAWLGEHYAINPAQLGTVALILGCFDLLASVSVSLFTDRIGKKRSVLLGAAGTLIGLLLLPLLNIGLAPAVLGLAITRGFAEFFIVSNISLLSEQVPTLRAKVMTLNVACVQIGFALAGFTGPWLYITYGVAGLALVSFCALLLASLLMLLRVRELPIASVPT